MWTEDKLQRCPYRETDPPPAALGTGLSNVLGNPLIRHDSTNAGSQRISVPPFTSMVAPVMKLAASEAKNATVSATSRGVPIRRIGTLLAILSKSSSSQSLVRSVRIRNGATAFTVTAYGARCVANDLVMLITAPLEAA